MFFILETINILKFNKKGERYALRDFLITIFVMVSETVT